LSNKKVVVTALLLFPAALFALSLTARNTLEYRGAEAEKGNNFFEDRLDLRLNYTNITLGATFEAMQPSRESALTRPDSTYTEITQRWVKLTHDVVEVTGGTFMTTLGNGFLLDAREQRDVQQDHHLDGVDAIIHAKNIDLTLLAGLADWDNNTQFKAVEINSYYKFVPVGGGYVRYDVNGGDVLPNLIGETWEVHASPLVGPVGADIRYAQTWRGPKGGGVEYTGNALYGSASTYFGPITLFGEVMQLDSFIVKGYGDENSSYITLPLIVHRPSYTLVSRHLATVSQREAIAFSGEIGVSSVFEGEIMASFAMIDNPDEATDYTEVFAEVSREWESLLLKGVYEFQQTADEDPAHNFIIEPLYYFTERTSLLLDIEFQTATEYDEKVNNLYGLAEFTVSPYGAFGVEGGRIMEWDDATSGLEPRNFIRFYIDGEIAENHRIMLAYGKRPGGVTCSGGTCRDEPQFEGFELKLSSSF